MSSSGVYFPTNLPIHLYGQVLTGSDLCDVLIEVADRRIPCHSAVISCASDIMRELLELAKRDQQGKKVIAFNAACSESMFCVLNFIYTGTETFNATNVTQVLHTALLVGCRTLQARCLNFLEMTRKSVLLQKAKMMAHEKKEISSTPASPSSGSDHSGVNGSTTGKTSHVQVHSVLRIAQPVSPELQPLPAASEQPCHGGKHHHHHHHHQGKQRPHPFLQYPPKSSQKTPNDVKKYCTECNRGFATVGSYTRHLRMIHYKLRPLNCDICGHAFYQRSDLKKHVQRQHQRNLDDKKLTVV